MKKNYLIAFLFPILFGTIGCEKMDDLPENPLSFDNAEISYEILPRGFHTRILCTSNNIAYTISNSGGICKTEDGGSTWIEQDSGVERLLRGIFFFDDLRGFVVGSSSINEGIILRTNDGGNSWEATDMPYSLSGIYFLDDKTGFVSGRKLYKTQDGGETWEEVHLGFSSYGDINFFDDKAGLLVSGKTLLITRDGGYNWTPLEGIGCEYYFDKIQINKGIAYILFDGHKVLKVTDKGNAWKVIEIPSADCVYFINEQQILVGGRRNSQIPYVYPPVFLWISNDYGRKWSEKRLEGGYEIIDIDFLNDSTALALVAPGYIIKINFRN
jgi:Uncharacterized protein related to plant photosystem II stability/assembly factor